MRNQKGFTLIELIIVIVVLGILAVTAAPQFINLAGDARSGTLQGMKASMQSASQLINARAKIKGQDSAAETASGEPFVDEGGTEIRLNYGYPASISMDDLLDFDSADWDVATTTGALGAIGNSSVTDETATLFLIWPSDQDSPVTDSGTCYAVYEESTGTSDKPNIEVESSGC